MEIKEKKIKVSVLTPAYNAGAFIGETIESILTQTYSDFEYIICDDCSTDDTWGIIQSYARRDPRIRAIRNEKNLGYGGAFNRMLSIAAGEYVACQPADDISMSFRLEHQLRFMEQHSKVGMCGGYLLMFDGARDLGIRAYPTEDEDMRRVVFRYMPLSDTVSMVRRRIYEELGGYASGELASDLEMVLRIGSKYKLANLPEVLLKNRHHATSVTVNKLKELELSTLAVRRQYAYGRGYSMTMFDRLYNVLQRISIALFSPRARMWLFMKMRDSQL